MNRSLDYMVYTCWDLRQSQTCVAHLGCFMHYPLGANPPDEKGIDHLPYLIMSRFLCLAKLRTDAGQRFRHPCIAVQTVWRASQPHSFEVCDDYYA